MSESSLRNIVKENLPLYASYGLIVTILATGLTCIISHKFRTLLLFGWYCFIKPFTPPSKNSKVDSPQTAALESFYQAQAKFYDTTRATLLRGRETSLKLAASHVVKSNNLIWVDVGGGTGYNVEHMNTILPISKHFKAIYVVDLSPSLLEVAQKRFAENGWKNVHCLLADACTFTIPYQSADLITFSYSLSMIPTFHSAIDHVSSMLSKDGVICCVDFGVQSSVTSFGRVNTLGGMTGRHIPWIFRTFWRIWFEADRVFLDPARRDYLEYRFGTLKSLNLYNKKLGNIPYYIWLGCDKDRSPALLHRVNALATESPYLAPKDVLPNEEVAKSKGHEAAVANQAKHLPYPSIYYQKDVYRVYYDELKPEYNQFNNQYIYAFTWEDPTEDAKILNLSSKDTVLAITSAGDNILSYASLPDPPRRIHGVDLNPCQGHLMELKLAAFKSLKREEVWKLFGLGKIEGFTELLVGNLAPHMSSNAFQYWYVNGEKTFGLKGRGLYDTGFSKWALRMARYVFKLFGTSEDVEEMCKATSIEEQRNIWSKKIRPTLFNPVVSGLLIGNPIFLWKALGVPANQATMMGKSVIKYVVDTLDPVISRCLISSENYFYYLCLKGRYSEDNCPEYLTKSVYKKFTGKDSPLDNIRIHTDFLNDVFARLTKGSLTVAVIMDHMDWFDTNGIDADEEISALTQALAPSGKVLLRSAATHPWYIKNFEKQGYRCKPAAIRTSGDSIDRINIGSTYINYGLKGYGFIPGDAVDKYKDTISFGSSVSLQKSSVSVSSGVYSFVTYNLPDRGWNTEGTLNYVPRIHKYDVTFTPLNESDSQNLIWDYSDSILLKDFEGNYMTGLDCNSTIEQNGYTLPAATFLGDGFGHDLNSTTTTTRVCLDPEALNLIEGDIANGFWISDEYGPAMYKFNPEGTLIDFILPPDAIVPYRDGSVSFSADSSPIWESYDTGDPDSGRANNQGFEGCTLSPDGKTLWSLLQSAAIQEGGTKKYYNSNTRMVKYDLSGSTPTLVGEYVLTLPTWDDPTVDADKNPRTAAQSELVYITDELFIVLARDSGRGRGGDETESLFRHADIYSLKDATNIMGLYDEEGDKIASKKGVLVGGITTATHYSFLDYNDNTELNKFGLHNGGDDDYYLLNEKWEGITLIPVECTTDEYFLLTVSDDDFITQNGFMNFGNYPYADSSGLNMYNQALVFKVKLPGLISQDSLPASCLSSSSSSSAAASSSTLASSYAPSTSAASSSSSSSSSLAASSDRASTSTLPKLSTSSLYFSPSTSLSTLLTASTSSVTSAGSSTTEASGILTTVITTAFDSKDTIVTIVCTKTECSIGSETSAVTTESSSAQYTTITTVSDGVTLTITEPCTRTTLDESYTTYTTFLEGATVTITELCSSTVELQTTDVYSVPITSVSTQATIGHSAPAVESSSQVAVSTYEGSGNVLNGGSAAFLGLTFAAAVGVLL
ncbi:hypothetical protein CANARDRAFT_175521 [[Candida] arabinofermentans NRRL YB-2248]|uniref:Uncharacterized protein n=1 Tax=[Candida] arabinofermentans NRRL YB-2248 TaxID=983967 RepID=A0A1E4T1X0_9ASCO|nr:hypothetical protein CANARDRAFT_175521 [[Candida] arabinofermentans NRRL YB-2248]